MLVFDHATAPPNVLESAIEVQSATVDFRVVPRSHTSAAAAATEGLETTGVVAVGEGALTPQCVGAAAEVLGIPARVEPVVARFFTGSFVVR
jgi:hypothetical protein